MVNWILPVGFGFCGTSEPISDIKLKPSLLKGTCIFFSLVFRFGFCGTSEPISDSKLKPSLLKGTCIFFHWCFSFVCEFGPEL
uniref:Uncharacterized protein n=1 Tax=Arundo donax TaxID=35708 RepID=A0A0A9HK36_ARUDO